MNHPILLMQKNSFFPEKINKVLLLLLFITLKLRLFLYRYLKIV